VFEIEAIEIEDGLEVGAQQRHLFWVAVCERGEDVSQMRQHSGVRPRARRGGATQQRCNVLRSAEGLREANECGQRLRGCLGQHGLHNL